MNSLLHIIALAVLIWFAWWLMDRGQTVPAIAMLGVGLVFVAWLIQAVMEDLGDIKGSANKRRGRR